MRNFTFWCRWLWIASLILIVFGVAMALLNQTIVFATMNRLIDPVFWPAGIPDDVPAFQGWVYGAWGATVIGWGVMTAVLARFAFPRREGWAWWAMVLGIGAWYVVDTAISAVYGVWVNVILNAVLMVLFALPLAATWRTCLTPPSGSG
jgi:hypothetical protein